MKTLIAAIVVIFTMMVVSFMMSTKVPAGYEAILVNQFGQNWVQDTPLVTGRVYYNPFTQDLVKYPVYVQTKDYEAFEVKAKDGSKFIVDPTISYRVNVGATPVIYQKYRKDISDITDVVMLQFVKDTFRIVLNKYTTDDMISKAWDIDAELSKTLVEMLAPEKITVERLTSWLSYPESMTNAIAAKNQAVQDAQRVENELRKAEAEAKIKQTNAEADAKAKITEAKANAEAIEIQSKAIQSQWGQDYVKLQWIKEVWAKWNGQLPTTSLSDGVNAFVTLPQ